MLSDLNIAHFHIVSVHVPVVGIPFALILLGFGFLFSNHSLVKASLSSMVILSLLAIPVYLSGESAEELLEGLQEFSSEEAKDAIEEHEERAEVAFIALETLGVLALLSLLLGRFSEHIQRLGTKVTFVGGLIVCGLLISTANLGGRISHQEVFQRSSTEP